MSNLSPKTHQHAWAIASDPAASEEKWIAAVTLLDGKTSLSPVDSRVPGWLRLPWALTIASCGTSGAVFLLVLSQLLICSRIAEMLPFASSASHTAAAVLVWMVPSLVFSMLFTYQRMLFNGGRTWPLIQWGVVLGYITSISLVAIDGQPVQLMDGILLGLWNLTCIGVAAGGTKMAKTSYKCLESTIGARKVVVPMTNIFAGVPLFLGGSIIVLHATGVFLLSPHFICALVAMVVGGSCYAVYKLNASNANSARAIAMFLWSPMIMSNLLLLPALAGTHAWLALTGTRMVSWVDYLGAVTGLVLSIATPLIGATLASKHLQARAALGLSNNNSLLNSNSLANNSSLSNVDSLAISNSHENSASENLLNNAPLPAEPSLAGTTSDTSIAALGVNSSPA